MFNRVFTNSIYQRLSLETNSLINQDVSLILWNSHSRYYVSPYLAKLIVLLFPHLHHSPQVVSCFEYGYNKKSNVGIT
jgi:hypothetical protein